MVGIDRLAGVEVQLPSTQLSVVSPVGEVTQPPSRLLFLLPLLQVALLTAAAVLLTTAGAGVVATDNRTAHHQSQAQEEAGQRGMAPCTL